MAMLALLLASTRTLTMVDSTENAIELVALAPTKAPKVLVDNTRPQATVTNIAIALAPTAFNSSSQSGSSSAPDGQGSAVNWMAEAHRAVRAYEIRRDQSRNSALSVSSSLDDSGAREHHAGDQVKTANGDWIVWLNSDCYQVATWRSGASAFGAISPQTICRNSGAAPHLD